MESSSDHKEMITEPLLSSNSNTKGGIRTLPFIIANEAFESLASYGLSPNLILYLTRDYGIDAAKGAQILLLFHSATFFTPVLGAFLADTYVGRYPMIGFGCIASLLGMVLFWLTTIMPGARPPHCVQFGHSCTSATASQLLILYSSFGLMAIGAGGIRSSSLAFGADQLGKRETVQNAGILQRFFSWYYATLSISIFVGMTCITFIQDLMGWKVGFGIPVVMMIMSAVSFFLASSIYVKSEPKATWLTGFAQVVVASFRKRNAQFSSKASDKRYHHRKGATVRVPSEKLRFLNKACLIGNHQKDLTPDGRISDPWSLCTVDQVEELKALIKLVPIWSTGMLMSINTCQFSFTTLQASTMDRHTTSNFEIPAGSFAAFMVFSSTVWVVLYDRLAISLVSKIKGRQTRLTLKQRMGIGILLSTAAMAALAIVENVRRSVAIEERVSDVPNAVLHISALWLLSYFCLQGFAEALHTISQNELYYTELPQGMSSVASNLSGMGKSAASLVASFIVSIVRGFTEGEDVDSWISSNINKGHYDYYYWLLSGFSFVNFIYFLGCAKLFGPCKGEEGAVTENEIDDSQDYIDKH